MKLKNCSLMLKPRMFKLRIARLKLKGAPVKLQKVQNASLETPTSAFAALHCTCKAQTCTFEALHCPFEAQDCPFEAPKHRSVDVGAVSIQKFFQGLAAPGPPPILLGAKKEGTGQHFLALRRKEGKSEGEGKVFAQPGRQTLRPSPSLLPSFHRARARGLAPVAWGHHDSPTQAISTPNQTQDSFALQTDWRH